MSVKVVTFGCRLNTVEAEVIKQAAQEANLQGLGKDALIFNTCAVTNEAVRQAKQAIRRARRANPEARIIVTGCAAQTQAQTFANMEAVDLIIGNEDKLHAKSYQQLPDFGLERYEKIKVNDIMSVKETAGHLISEVADKTRAFVQIQNGCDHRCTFCIIPYGRGPSRSVPMGAVAKQIQTLVNNNYQEIVLTGVDLTSYGCDLPGTPSLARLLAHILNEVPDLERLRLSSVDSIEIDDELFKLLVEEKRIMPHLHLSLQAGDDLILKRMKRRHLRQDAINFCKKLKQLRPEVVFGADLIAGFPTETDAMFQQTLNLVEECDLTYLHVFPYSPREQTPAARMPQVEKQLIRERAHKLREIGQQQLQKFFKKSVGTVQKVLIEQATSGRGENYAPIELSRAFEQGSIVSAKIINYNETNLIAVPSESELSS